MAKNLTMQSFQDRQSGFSLVEMLAAAFIMAIGILGILMMQMIAIRATRGSSNMITAARIARQVIDQAELEGRLSWLNITEGNKAMPTLGDLNGFNLKYIVIEAGKQLEEAYNIKGNLVDKDSADAFFKVATRRESKTPSGASNPVGAISDFQVRVIFSDEVGADKRIITRTFNLTRRIIHG